MESHCIYEVSRPSARTGARLRFYAKCCPNRVEAARRERGIFAPDRGSGVVHRVAAAERAA